MSDMIKIPDVIRRKDAIDAVGNMLRRKFGIGGDLAEITLVGLPSVQDEIAKAVAAVIEQPPITRCKDCDDWDRDNVINNAAECAEWSDPENGMTRYTKECDFCSRAERRTDEQ